MKKILLGSLILLVILYSCAKNSTSGTCNPAYNGCAAIAPQYEIDSVAKYLSDNNIHDTVKHCSGMFYKIDTVGSGKSPDICSSITISYKGQLEDGTTFDQSSSLTYLLSRFILGFRNGILLIKEGGTIHLYIPPSLAYGSQGVTGIPPNSMLIFDVTLLSVQ